MCADKRVDTNDKNITGQDIEVISKIDRLAFTQDIWIIIRLKRSRKVWSIPTQVGIQ